MLEVFNSTVQEKWYYALSVFNIGLSVVDLRNTELELELNLNERIKYKCYLNLNWIWIAYTQWY